MQKMLEQTVTIKSKEGLHARPASLFVAEAVKFSSCTIKVAYHDKVVNAKSIISVLSLGVTKDSQVTIQTEGDCEKEAMQSMLELCKNTINQE